MSNSNTTFAARFGDFRRKHPIIMTFVWIFLAGLVVVWGCLLFLDAWTHHGDDATVPEVKSLSYTDAARVLREAGLNIEISDSIYDKSRPAGTVVESWPKAGAVVKNGRQVYVTITAFSPKHVSISQPITGVSARQALSYLNALGINAIRLVNVPSQYPDLVEGAEAEGRPLGVGSVLPVNATVILKVGTVPQADVRTETDSVAAEPEYENSPDLMSTYTDEEE